MNRLAVLFAVSLFATIATAPAEATTNTNHAISTAAELSQALAAGYEKTGFAKFDLVVTVTFPCEGKCRTFSAEDSTGPITMREVSMWKNNAWGKPMPILQRGDRIRAIGHVVRWESTDIAMAEVQSLQTLSHSTLPPIPSVAAEELTAEKWENRPIMLRGIVKDAFLDEIG